MTQESEGSKRQWPPVGKSSDTPKEVKIARREGLPPVIREARRYGAGCVYNHQCYPGYMRVTMCIICEEIKETELTEGPDTDGECWPMCEACWNDL